VPNPPLHHLFASTGSFFSSHGAFALQGAFLAGDFKGHGKPGGIFIVTRVWGIAARIDGYQAVCWDPTLLSPSSDNGLACFLGKQSLELCL
jgi:hypothetical protein